MTINNNNLQQQFRGKNRKANVVVMHQSIAAVPIPPHQCGNFPHCQSLGPVISLPQGI